MKLTLKRSNLLEIISVLKMFIDNSQKEMYKKQFNVFLETNYNRLLEDAKITLSSHPKDSDEYSKYVEDLDQINKQFSSKDEKGNPIRREDGAYAMTRDRLEEYQNVIKKLDEQYKELIDLRKKEDEEYKEVLNEEIEVDLIKISFVNIPDSYSFSGNKVLMSLIKETPEEIEAML